jgi:RecJ-like exonuclease
MKKFVWMLLMGSLFSSCSVALSLLTGTHVESQTCHTCHGDGKCDVCNGGGTRLIVENESPKSIKCTNCSGKGRCPACGGTGIAYVFEELNRY